MWSELIVGLDLATSGEILMAGPGVAGIDFPTGAGSRWSNGELVVVTRGESPPEDASIRATGVEDNRFDLVVLWDAFGSLGAVPSVLSEVYRVLKPGAGVLISEFNVVALLEAPPQRYPQRLLSDIHPPIGEHLRAVHPPSEAIAMELVRTGFKDADSYGLDFPLGHFRDYEAHADFVAVDGWRGMELLTPEERESFLELLPELMKSAAPAGEFDDLEPVTVARGYKPI